MLKKVKKPKTDADYEKLGRIVSSIFDSGYLDISKSYKTSFYKGMFSGFGGVLGATILVALFIWLISLFHQTPLIGPFVNKIRTTVEQRKIE